MPQSSLVGPAILITCLITLPLTVISDAVAGRTGWQSLWLGGASVLVGLEAVALRSRMVAGLHETQGGAVRYLTAEVFGLVALARIVATAGQGARGLAAMSAWLTDPLAAFDAPFLFCLLALLAVAVLSRSGIAAIAALTPNPPLKTPLQSLDLLFYRSDTTARRRAAVAAISRGAGWGGLAMLVVLGRQSEQTPTTVLWMALYLAGGLWLIALAQRRALLADWQSDEAEIAPEVNRRWHWLSIATIGLVTLLALALPAQMAPLVPEAWREGLFLLGGIVLLIAMILSLLFIGLLSLVALLPLLLLMLLTSLMNSTVAPATPIAPPMMPPPAPSEPPLWPGIIFWICIAILTGLAFWTIMRRQAWIRQVWEQAPDWWAQVRTQLRKRRFWRWRQPVATQRLRESRSQPAPRDAAIVSYHAALRYAAAHGYPRRPPQTPAEFADRTAQQLGEADDALHALTAAYHRAAYAGRASDQAERRQVGILLRQFRRTLTKRRRGGKGAEDK
ncbi:hypothetical protein A6A03_18665 [Chloroflexus islandicus]|uniref:Protein-glutamine gamma-glutamyltransferase-like C-terminal domain-containing protein n=1 Tax=Chloroflexus islandicus TaxID=1707952 RepID=A0A178M5F8_9CHLR|nr:DUF4129 domain-containing protein [Chloroflexus islandicus]OAN42682.1 hypothetical protein A6A03_18665 [Chloroflexus islandicus]